MPEDVARIFTDPILLTAHVVTLVLITVSVYSLIGYRNQVRPMWLILIAWAAMFMVVVDLGLVAMYWGVSHGE
jgi:hypothetical protein